MACLSLSETIYLNIIYILNWAAQSSLVTCFLLRSNKANHGTSLNGCKSHQSITEEIAKDIVNREKEDEEEREEDGAIGQPQHF